MSRGGADSGGNLWHTAPAANTQQRPLYGYSPVFKVAAAATGPVVSVRLMVAEGENRNDDGEVEKPEADETVPFPLTLDAQPAGPLTVCVRVAESGDTDRVAMADEGIKTVSFLTSVQTGSIDVAWTDTMNDDLDSVITVTAVPSSTVGCSSTDSYTVSGTHGSDKVRITDDEATEVTLTSSDTQMEEQDASDTATLTVSLGRALVAGESLLARITLATSTGARLPDHATPDFAVTATGTGVALTNATTVTPLLTFTGSDSNTVQSATVTLTPITTADDGDTSDETVTATLGLVTGRGSGTVVTGGGVEVGSSSTATLTIDDNDTSDCVAQSTVLSVSDIRITENGGEATYCVRLTNAPSGGNTTVTIGRMAGAARFDPSTYTVIVADAAAATVSPATLTFTAANFMEPQQVTVTAVDDDSVHENRRLNLTHTAAGGGYSSSNSNDDLGDLAVLVTDAPELEVFEYRGTYDDAAYGQYRRDHDGWGIHRPNTITSTPGIVAMNDLTPATRLDYFVRLSSQPDGDVTVTLTVDDVRGTAANFSGISYTPNGPRVQSLTFTFTDEDPVNGCGARTIPRDRHWDIVSKSERAGVSDTYHASTRVSWQCYRVIYGHNTRGLNVEGTQCADVVHTATGGGFRSATVDTLRIRSLGKVYGNNPRAYYKGVSIRVTGYWRDSPPTYTFDPKTQKFNVEYGPAVYETRTVNNIALYKDTTTNKYYDLVSYQRGTRIWIMREVPSSAFNTVWDQSGPTVLANTLNLDTVYSSTGRNHSPADCRSLGRAEERRLKGGQSSPLPATAPSAPTTAVANLSLTASDDGTSVTVDWDAVPDATHYNVDYTADGGPDSLSQSAGHFDDVTATSVTFDHGLMSLDTLTVTVTPGHDSIDKGIVYFNDLAATATLNPRASSGTQCTPNLPNDAVTLTDVTGWRDAVCWRRGERAALEPGLGRAGREHGRDAHDHRRVARE